MSFNLRDMVDTAKMDIPSQGVGLDCTVKCSPYRRVKVIMMKRVSTGTMRVTNLHLPLLPTVRKVRWLNP